MAYAASPFGGDAQIFKDKNGTVYGFVHEDTIYIDPRIATAETPIHEYTHLWAAALRDNNREEWKNIVQMMKDTPEVWNDVKQQYPNLKTDDEIASEALAQYSGQRGSKQLQKFADGQSDPKGIFEKVTAALGKFWNAVSDFLHLHYNNKEEVADRVLHDMLSGVNPLKYKVTEEQTMQDDRENMEQKKQEPITFEKVKTLAEDLNLDYMPLTLRTPVVVEDFDSGETTEKKVFCHVMVQMDDIEVFEDRSDAYDCRGGISLNELPKEARSQVYAGIEELLTQDDRQLCLFVDKKDVPDYALPAIVNGDYSGLTDEDAKNIKDFLDKYPDCILSPREERPYFNTHPAFGLDTDCVPVDIVRIVTPRQLLEEIKAQEEKETKHEQSEPHVKENTESTKKVQEKNAKEEKAQIDPAMAKTATLLIDALEMARANNGVWLNKCGNLSDDVVKQSRTVKPYEALKMVLEADTQGECPKVDIRNESALYKQAKELKEKHPDAMILMRGGDFYEIWGEDADKAARILGIAVSERELNRQRTAYTAFPHHSLDVYLPKLVRAGLRIAICDELSDNKQQKKEADAIYKEADNLVKAMQKQDKKIQVNPLVDTTYNHGHNVLCINDTHKSAYGKEVETATVRVNDIYRAAIAYTGAEGRLNRVAQTGMQPENAQKYDRLVSELAAGVIMGRQGLPARLSTESMEHIPYWQEQLKDNPQMLANIERDVNNAIQVLGKISRDDTVDYTAILGQQPKSKNQSEVVAKVSEPQTENVSFQRKLGESEVRQVGNKVAHEIRMSTGKDENSRKTRHI